MNFVKIFQIPTTTATAYAQALTGGEVIVTAVVGPKNGPALPKQHPSIH